MNVRACRWCGCTDDDCSYCIERTGRPCAWYTDDLCSACAEGYAERRGNGDYKVYRGRKRIGDVMHPANHGQGKHWIAVTTWDGGHLRAVVATLTAAVVMLVTYAEVRRGGRR